MRVVVAVHTREVKTALFLALSGMDAVTIVATATSTAELVSYCRSFQPDVAIFEHGLAGKPMVETLEQLDGLGAVGKVLVIDGHAEATRASISGVFTDVDDLVASLADGRKGS